MDHTPHLSDPQCSACRGDRYAQKINPIRPWIKYISNMDFLNAEKSDPINTLIDFAKYCANYMQPVIAELIKHTSKKPTALI